jgi:hypothetical protein
MIKTIQRIRLPEVNSGRSISTRYSINRNGVLRFRAEKKQPTLRMRWRMDVISGRLIAYWESGDTPDSRLHRFSLLLSPEPARTIFFHRNRTQRSLEIRNLS